MRCFMKAIVFCSFASSTHIKDFVYTTVNENTLSTL
jgi:hypothetical protein